MNKKQVSLITDEGGMLFGVVVRFKPGTDLKTAKEMAIKEIAKYEKIGIIDAKKSIDNSTLNIETYRWIPRHDGIRIRPHIEPAEPGSLGSWIGAYWEYQYW